MTEHQPPDDQVSGEQQRKRRRWRVRLDNVKAEWPVSGGLTLAGTGFIGVLLVVLAWWIFHQPQAKVAGLTGTAIPASSPAPPPEAAVPAPPPAPAQAPPPAPAPAPAPPPPPASAPAPAPPPHPAPPPQQVPVPNVVGYDRVRAERMLNDKGLTVGSVTEEESSEHASGLVLRTNPRADTMVRPNSSVDLALAKCAVRPSPNVIGYDRATAQQILSQHGLSVGSVTEEESNERVPGLVLRTNPRVGSEVQCGSRVGLVVAKAPVPRPVRVPDVVGHYQATAQQILRQHGLSDGSVTEQESNERVPGAVLRTNPRVGSEVQRGSRVGLVVAKAPSEIEGEIE